MDPVAIALGEAGDPGAEHAVDIALGEVDDPGDEHAVNIALGEVGDPGAEHAVDIALGALGDPAALLGGIQRQTHGGVRWEKGSQVAQYVMRTPLVSFLLFFLSTCRCLLTRLLAYRCLLARLLACSCSLARLLRIRIKPRGAFDCRRSLERRRSKVTTSASTSRSKFSILTPTMPSVQQMSSTCTRRRLQK